MCSAHRRMPPREAILELAKRAPPGNIESLSKCARYIAVADAAPKSDPGKLSAWNCWTLFVTEVLRSPVARSLPPTADQLTT